MPNSYLYILLLLLGICLVYQIKKGADENYKNQIGGDNLVSTNIIAEEASATQFETDILTESYAGTEPDYTDANLSRSDINTIINGTSYITDERANMYFTGKEVDGIGNFTIDGTNRVQGQPQPRRIGLGRVIEDNPWKMVNFRPRSNDSAFRISRAGIRQLDVMQIFDFMGRTSFVIRIKGTLPNACNQLRILPVKLDPFNNIRVTVYSIFDPLLLCPGDVKEWQVTIPLQQLQSGYYNIVLNNQAITTLTQN